MLLCSQHMGMYHAGECVCVCVCGWGGEDWCDMIKKTAILGY